MTMELVITPNSIITAASLVTAATALIALLVKVIHWIDKQKEQSDEIQQIKAEQQIVCYGILAALDGLKQLGANGNVTKAHESLEKHLNSQSHK